MNGPLIVQSDHTLMLEVAHPRYSECRDFLVTFAELVKSPEFIHTYRVTPLSLWNAAALDLPLSHLLDGLERFSRYDLPPNVLTDMNEWYGVYGRLILEKDGPGQLRHRSKTPPILNRLRHKSLQTFWQAEADNGFQAAEDRGNVKGPGKNRLSG
jgi:DNA excision repair protein ERCC-3